MAETEGAGMRIGALFGLSLGPFLVMIDLIVVVIVSGEVKIGIGAPGKAFPSYLGLFGFMIWLAGMTMIMWLKKEKTRKLSLKARPIFLKGRKGIKCNVCRKWIDAGSIDYHERISCQCGALYDMFQEGPWDNEEITEEADRSLKEGRKLKGNVRSPKKLSRPPSR